MKETKFENVDISIGSIVVRNGNDINGLYKPEFDGMVCEVVRITGRILTVRYFRPITTRTGAKIWGDTISTNCISYREDGTPDIIIRRPITGIPAEVLEQFNDKD